MRRTLPLSALLLMLFITVSTRAERIPSPSGVFYYLPGASVDGFEASWINPAALAWSSSSGFQLMFDHDDNSLGRSWGAVVNRQSTAIGYRYLDDGSGDIISEMIVATGMKLGKTMALGLIFRRYNNRPDSVVDQNSWGLSISSRTGGPLQWSAQWNNLNRSRYRGVETEIEQRYSLSYKLYRDILIVSTDAFFATGQKLSNADLVYHLGSRPTRKIFIDAFIDSDNNFGVGIRINLTQYLFGLKGAFSSGGSYERSTYYLGATDFKQPSRKH